MYLCHPKLRDKLDMKKHLILLSLASQETLVRKIILR